MQEVRGLPYAARPVNIGVVGHFKLCLRLFNVGFG